MAKNGTLHQEKHFLCLVVANRTQKVSVLNPNDAFFSLPGLCFYFLFVADFYDKILTIFRTADLFFCQA